MSRDRTRTRDRSGSPAGNRDEGGDGSDVTDATDVTDVDLGLGDPATSTADEPGTSTGGEPGGGLRDRVATRASRLFAPRRFLLAMVLSAVGLVAAGTFVPLPASGLLGVFAATFLFGLVLEDRRYAEAAVAGGLTVGTSFLLDFAVVAALGGFGPSLAVVGLGVGAVVGVLGAYFGRDLRRGLTRDVP